MKRHGPIDGEGAGLVCCFGGFARAEAELTTATSQHGLWRTNFTQTNMRRPFIGLGPNMASSVGVREPKGLRSVRRPDRWRAGSLVWCVVLWLRARWR